MSTLLVVYQLYRWWSYVLSLQIWQVDERSTLDTSHSSIFRNWPCGFVHLLTIKTPCSTLIWMVFNWFVGRCIQSYLFKVISIQCLPWLCCKMVIKDSHYCLPNHLEWQHLRKVSCCYLFLHVAHDTELISGWLEVMLDRRLMQDDNRGLGQGVKDNLVTSETFRLLLEKRHSSASVSSSCAFCMTIMKSIFFSKQPSAALVYPSLSAHTAIDNLLHPVLLLLSGAPSLLPKLPPYSALKSTFPCDLHLVNFRTLFTSQPTVTESAVILHRRGFDCGFDTHSIECPLTNGQVCTMTTVCTISTLIFPLCRSKLVICSRVLRYLKWLRLH